ncbi:hypothetical protein R6Q57_019195 [Mikania cordata]
MSPPSLLSLAIDATLYNLHNISDLSFLPEHVLSDLFLRTLKAGKLTERILKIFIATDKEEDARISSKTGHCLTSFFDSTDIQVHKKKT